MMVNGRTWPDLEVERRRYRLRLLNGCGSRFLHARRGGAPDRAPGRPGRAVLAGRRRRRLPGGAGGDGATCCSAPPSAPTSSSTSAPSAAGTELYLVNEAPDEPFGGGEPGEDFEYANPATTGQVMRFTVVDRVGAETSAPPEQLIAARRPRTGAGRRTRALALARGRLRRAGRRGPRAAFLGVMDGGVAVPLALGRRRHREPRGSGTPRSGSSTTTPRTPTRSTCTWCSSRSSTARPSGEPRATAGAERERAKDTVIAYPDEVTRIRAHFDKPGLFVWHCHILEHEDHEMMRPFRVG